MLKLRGTNKSGRPSVILGLSRLNCERLLAKKPIHIFAEELSIGFDITIFAGETEDKMTEELRAAGISLPEPERPAKNKQ